MGDLLAKGFAWLDAMRKKHASQSVTFRRGEQAIEELAATPGTTTFDVVESTGLMRSLQSRDYLISVSDLKLDDAAIEPAIGDRIEEAVGDSIHVYECMGFGGQPAWRYSDPIRNTYRIHTKLLRIQPAE